MGSRLSTRRICGLVGTLAVIGSASVNRFAWAADDVDAWLEAIRAVQPLGGNHEAAMAAGRHLRLASAAAVPRLLAGMDGANPLAQNWLRGIIQSVVQRAESAGQPIPLDELEKFLQDTSHAPRARRFAFDLLAARDATAPDRLIPGWLDDPSLELRRDAVSAEAGRARGLLDGGQSAEGVRALRRAFQAARDVDQVKAIAESLRNAKEKADIARHMGFLMDWYLIGPFDNRDKRGFDVAYPPESEFDAAKTYPGKEGVETHWIRHATSDDFGVVDLNTALAKHKGAIAYAFTEFLSNEDRPVELRLGCINGNKIWLNGQLLTSNHVYHASTFVDQYTGHGKLLKGRNTILLKIAQNEQTEQWAQNWKFQLRACDSIGTAVLSQDRASEQAASTPRLPIR